MRSIPVPLTIPRALADETLRRLKLAGEIEHPGESGRAREQILMAFIQQLTPSSFGVSAGFVVDALGGKSKQIDVVVYRTDFAPAFQIGGVKHFLIESVVAVLEVKAAIDSHADLTRALDNIASVKALDRTNRGRNKLLNDRVRTELSVVRRHRDGEVAGQGLRAGPCRLAQHASASRVAESVCRCASARGVLRVLGANAR